MSLLVTFSIGEPTPLLCQTADSSNVEVLMLRADSLYYQKQFVKAINLFDQVQRVYSVQGKWHQQAICLQKMGTSYRELSNLDAGEAYLDSAIVIMETKVGPEATHKVLDMYLDYANVFHRGGNSLKALEVYEKTFQIAQERCEPTSLIMAHIYRDLGGINAYLHNYKAAINYLEKAEAIYQLLKPDMEQYYMLYRHFFTCYYNQRDYETALDYLLVLDRWLSTFKSIPLHVRAEIIYMYLGIVYLEMGNYPMASYNSKKALTLCRERFGERHHLNIQILQVLGTAQMDENKIEEAIPTLKEALSLNDSLSRGKRYSISGYINQLVAECLELSGKVEEADTYWKSSFELSTDSIEIIKIINVRAEVLCKKKRWEEGGSLYNQLITEVRKLNGERGAYLGALYLNMGKTLYALQRYDEAIEYFDKGIALHSFVTDGPSKRPVSLSPLLSPFLFSCKAKALLAQWRASPSDLRLLEAAWANTQHCTWLLESIKQFYHERVGSKRYVWGKNTHEAYALGIEIAQLMAVNTQRTVQKVESDFYWERAFQLSEKDRALVLLENLHLTGTERFYAVPTALRKAEIRLSRAVVSGEVLQLEYPNIDTVAQQELLHVRRDFEALGDTLAHSQPNYYAFKYDMKPASVKGIRQRLPSDALFISYFLHQAARTLYIFAIDKKTGLHVHTVPLTTSLSNDVEELARLQRSVGLVRAEKRQQFIQLNHAFYKTLIGPLEGLLADKKRLIVVANDVLHYLPFEALLRSDANKPFDQLDFLLRRFEVSYHYSASLYAKSKASVKPAVNPKVLAFAPNFPGTAEVKAEGDEQSREWNDAYDPLSSVLRPLPYSVQEVQTVLDSFSGAGSVGLVKEQATEAALKRALGSPYDVLHFATHSFANVEQPSLSGISCGQGLAQDSTEDGTLHVNELYQMPLSADLVVLSSCESGVGHSVGNEGPLGINRAFEYAGVPNVLFSLWKVNDKAGSALMVEFYRQLHAGKTYSAALRGAKLKLLTNVATASPNFWSGFLLVGN